jgi:hypothetical protein
VVLLIIAFEEICCNSNKTINLYAAFLVTQLQADSLIFYSKCGLWVL